MLPLKGTVPSPLRGGFALAPVSMTKLWDPHTLLIYRIFQLLTGRV
jgi:hypothetical protein